MPPEIPTPAEIPPTVSASKPAGVPASALTKKQQTILDAIVFLMQKGEVPTVREVGALVGLRSPATVLKHLRGLEDAGLISLSGKSRGIRIADAEVLERLLAGKTGMGKGGMAEAQIVPLHRAGQHHRPFAGRVPLVGAIAAGQPFESYSDAFTGDAFTGDAFTGGEYSSATSGPSGGAAVAEDESFSGPAVSGPAVSGPALAVDPRMFCDSGEVLALRVEGDSMINAGILDGDYAIIRRQSTVEEGEIAAVIINGEGTLKRWRSRGRDGKRGATVSLGPENERFEPIEISEADGKEVLVIGKYVGLVRGSVRL